MSYADKRLVRDYIYKDVLTNGSTTGITRKILPVALINFSKPAHESKIEIMIKEYLENDVGTTYQISIVEYLNLPMNERRMLVRTLESHLDEVKAAMKNKMNEENKNE